MWWELFTHEFTIQIWNTTYRINRLNELVWKATVRNEVEYFQSTLMQAIRLGYDGKEYGVVSQWTFTGAFLFSLTVITTIGELCILLES